jgi:hypothetical protein
LDGHALPIDAPEEGGVDGASVDEHLHLGNEVAGEAAGGDDRAVSVRGAAVDDVHARPEAQDVGKIRVAVRLDLLGGHDVDRYRRVPGRFRAARGGVDLRLLAEELERVVLGGRRGSREGGQQSGTAILDFPQPGYLIKVASPKE